VIRTIILSALAALFAAAPAAGQSAAHFNGRLVREDGKTPIPRASITIAGLPGSVRSDNNGAFTWAPAPTPPFQVIVVLEGGVVAQPIVIEEVMHGVRIIPVRAISAEVLTVLGAAPSVAAPPSSATNIVTSAQISARHPATLIRALDALPGIGQVSEGHSAVPAVRGLARGRTLLLIDGVRVTSERRVGPSASFLNPSIVEAIDVARGPGSVAYGSDALGGVISIRTHRAQSGGPLTVRAAASLGGGEPEQSGSLTMSKGIARGGLFAAIHARRAEDYHSPRGEVFNSAWHDRGAFVRFSQALSAGHMAVSWQSDTVRDAGRPRNNSQSVRVFNPFEDSHRFTASYETPGFGRLRQLSITGFVGSIEQRTDQDRQATASAGRAIEGAESAAKDFQLTGRSQILTGSARVDFGAEVNGRYDLTAVDTVQQFDLSGAVTVDNKIVSIDSARRINSGAFLQVEYSAGRFVHASGGVRGDIVKAKNVAGYFGDHATSNTAISGFGAVTVRPPGRVTLTAQISRGFRDPVLSDRYFRGPSGRGFITGNPQLQPEQSLQFDLAGRYIHGRHELALYAYSYRIDDLIERFQTQTDFFFFRNRGRARLRGFELETHSRLGTDLILDVAASIGRGRSVLDAADLDDIASDKLSVTARKLILKRGYVHVRLAAHAADRRPGPSEVAAPAATLLDAGAGWTLHSRVQIRGTVQNLLNDSFYASPDPRWVWAPGRSAQLTAVVEF
jgi:outer membrane receptor protein involved in Fe transport